jgi:hypothetical protein
MKNLFTIMFLLFLVTVSVTQAQVKTPVEKVFTGSVYIDGTVVSDKLTLVDNKFKRGMLYDKARTWVRTNYTFGGDAIMYEDGKSIKIVSEFDRDKDNIDYTLFLEFKDGKFNYTYTDNTNCSKAVIDKYVKPTIEDLAKYLKRGRYDEVKK